VAAAGGHHLLLIGPPGAGKTMLAERLPGLLPPLDVDQALEVTRIHSAAGIPLPPGVLVRRPPMRAPHHSASLVSLIGGGSTLMRPGELSCAHHGVLFLDELGEFPSDVLDTLRQPLEEGWVLVCRARASVVFPAQVLLVAAMNPCPCGGDGGPGACRCRQAAKARYASRVSGPLLDRFDLRVVVDRPDVAELLAIDGTATAATEGTEQVAKRVASARNLARVRGVSCNAALPSSQLDAAAPLESGARRLLEVRLRQGRLSARGLHRVRRVARTLADLGGREGPIGLEDVYGALALRADVFAAPQDAS
jgi:magnesium chelatase family protein